MKVLLLLLAVLGLSIYGIQQQGSLQSGFLEKTSQTEQQYIQFQEWKEQHGVMYETHEEDQYRFEIFLENLEYVLRRNQEEGYEMLGMNILSDINMQEYRQRYLNAKEFTHKVERKEQQETQMKGEINVPDQVDWVQKGAVSPVVDARNCASSYAIASAAALAAQVQINEGDLIPMSAQQLVDCDNTNGGCRGGSDYYSYLYAMQNGVEPDSDYPYKGHKTTCAYQQSNVFFIPKDALRIKYNDGAQIEQSLSEQPLSAWIDADCQDFKQYRGGDRVFTGSFCPDDELNYIVLLTGYNNSADKPYYTLQASYGTRWGNDGYMYIQKKSGRAPLGINQRVSFPYYNRYN